MILAAVKNAIPQLEFAGWRFPLSHVLPIPVLDCTLGKSPSNISLPKSIDRGTNKVHNTAPFVFQEVF